MFSVTFLVFVFAPLVFGSLVFHCPRSFVLRVRVFLHIIYLAFIVILASVLRELRLVKCSVFMFGLLLVLVFRPSRFVL